MNREDASVFLLLGQLSHLSRYHAMKKMEALDLKPGQAGILFILNSEGSLSQKELAERMGVTPPSMTVALKKMEGRGYVEKETDKCDQRIVRVRLSEKGRECIEGLKGMEEEMEELLFRGMSHEERLLMRRLLLEMRKNLMNRREFRGMDVCAVMEKTHPPKHMIDEKKVF